MKIIFDIGGTNTRISSINGGELGIVLKVATAVELENAKKIIVESVRKISDGEIIDSIVGGIAGIIKNGVIINSPNLKSWNGFDIRTFLQENFCEKVSIYNDADLAGLGESVYGAGKGVKIVAYIGLGTGVGGTRIVDEEIDANRNGFEPGHHILDITNGKTFEDIVSGRAIFAKHKKSAEKTGQEKIKELIPALATGLYNAIVFWSPDVLVVGGALMNEETAYKIEDVKKAIKAIKSEMKILPEIRKAKLGDLSGLYGALVLTERM
ncbi:hypothetical protein A2732_01615 [Candidatus Nomurabacteria bacterium RIFCSPHIGHO2_01_FULL_40_10]|nr:MAG: hypothetical protein A2732_01615 [Candidatus Nomurabacteria bacterium RIFCSPHIGHO2_01_FULL_40_10]